MIKEVPKYKIGIVGLGYVGLPLALEFSQYFDVIGFDLDKNRINELNSLVDKTNEVDLEVLEDKLSNKSPGLFVTHDFETLRSCNIYIITVPTPIDNYKIPDLQILKSATEEIGKIIKKDDIIIFESTVYPGCTEECCVPILEFSSKLIYNEDFFVAYSPERINPGDKVHTLKNIKKIVSGSTPEIAFQINELYSLILENGTYLAPTIKVAEAAKAVENAQRDINIAFMNELSYIFERLNINTYDVLEAAGSKWNFLDFKPGLVGGHCISVDPHYLSHVALRYGYFPQIINAARQINDSMSEFIVTKIIKLLISNKSSIKSNSILILGASFKENCPDFRNSKVIDIYYQLLEYGLKVDIVDPLIDKVDFRNKFRIEIANELPENYEYDLVLVAVAHNLFRKIDFNVLKSKGILIFDVKGFMPKNLIDGSL